MKMGISWLPGALSPAAFALVLPGGGSRCASRICCHLLATEGERRRREHSSRACFPPILISFRLLSGALTPLAFTPLLYDLVAGAHRAPATKSYNERLSVFKAKAHPARSWRQREQTRSKWHERA